ncbi:hypothetical protein IWW36_003997 [Coemansia brasiliensis]|uniref:SRA1/Sec31 domain-containing protein n=1 Tax=Coemansia brasiliensis TaxID=2650707 RepID=A0A9W8I6M5_9FUNG|nr:hypothetical protein IWW36_003997 [Coemansia brasiliensis]
MPFMSILKRLTGATGDDTTASEQPTAATCEPAKSKEEPQEIPTPTTPIPPPPKSALLSKPATTAASSTSITSLRTQVETEKQNASSASMYRDFTGGGHADAGHWNDPPTVVFKQPAKKKHTNDAESETSSFMLVDNAVTPNATSVAAGAPSVDVPDGREEQNTLIVMKLDEAMQSLPAHIAETAINRRMADDTNKRLALLKDRLPQLDDSLAHAVCQIALLIDKGLLMEAADAHRNLMQSGHESELKWLVGIKRLIELCQKSVA